MKARTRAVAQVEAWHAPEGHPHTGTVSHFAALVTDISRSSFPEDARNLVESLVTELTTAAEGQAARYTCVDWLNELQVWVKDIRRRKPSKDRRASLKI